MAIMENKDKTSRKKFVVRGLGGLATVLIAASLPFAWRKKPQKKAKMVRMLTEDGRLVEVDESLLPSNKRKVTDGELQGWIKKNKR
ncbi:MAG: hypothetical protein Q8927_05265 [Bacteroidota bacterium]|nr:hypothetical protein [Bacteroidota bacterium]